MKITIYYCDICKKENPQDELRCISVDIPEIQMDFDPKAYICSHCRWEIAHSIDETIDILGGNNG